MAEVLGFAASVIAVIQLTAKATSLGYGYISGVKRASDDLHQLVDELGLLSKVLSIVQKVADSNSQFETLEIFNKPTPSGKLPLQTCASDLRRLVAKLEPGEGLKGIANSLKWPFREKEILQHIERIEGHKNTLILALNADHILLSKDIKIDVQEIKVDVRATTADIHGIKRKFVELEAWTQKEDAAQILKRRRKVLQWIHPEAIEKKHNDISRRRRKNTGEWILRAPEFLEWTKEDTNRRLLWAYGIPGAGKTFLSSVVIGHLLSQARIEDYGVAYIYFDYKERGQQEPTSILSSLWGGKPSLDDLFSTLLSTSKSFSQTFIVCDALDECDQKAQRHDLLPLFHKMAESGIHLFITSRPHPEDINYSFKLSAKIELWAKDQDIKSYIEQKIDEHPRARVLVDRANCKAKIISELTKCAKGMFLLVHFHIEYLCQQTTVKQILAELEKLKGSSSEDSNPLKPTYDRAMETLLAQPKSCVELATRTLSWLVKARQTLTVPQLQLAVSVNQDCTVFDEMDIPESNTLLDVCASLVIIDEKSGTIKLAHYTVQEYLLTSPIIHDAELKVAVACTTFLSYDIFAQATTRNTIRHKYYYFLSYAVAWLDTHLVACDEALTTVYILRFLQSIRNILSYGHALCSLSIYTLSSRQQNIIKIITDSRSSPKEHIPLFVAVVLRHCPVVRLLLEGGADIEASHPSGDTPLHLAVLSGHEPMVRLLLEKGADIEARDNSGQTPLHRVAYEGYEPMARLLLEKGADIEARDDSRQTPLHCVAFRGYEPIARLLLEKGADIEARDDSRQTPLHRVAHQGYEPIARLLLEKGADIEARDDSRQTPLHCVAHQGYEPMTRLLLEKGADIEARDDSGETPLHCAVYWGEELMTRLLLEKGADIEARDDSSQTPLHFVASQGYEPIARLLLEKGADIEARDDSGQTPLHCVAYQYYEPIARLLLEKGADIEARDLSGETPLHLVRRIGNKSIIQVLNNAPKSHPLATLRSPVNTATR